MGILVVTLSLKYFIVERLLYLAVDGDDIITVHGSHVKLSSQSNREQRTV